MTDNAAAAATTAALVQFPTTSSSPQREANAFSKRSMSSHVMSDSVV